eukprot:CAMPEP_0197882688 /NCGR_PEP_ID=MMETSP1439-20131203/9750_1 /TAXON_ID=66791 /ORGANISM="Gonyaulax spinifera, Strain CCMP409" /LENGTH=749 /DNA_ID=CAMNT_0043502357 /DNA_START=54 /DNA_END=2303 /DNA_ORIENTATION=-
MGCGATGGSRYTEITVSNVKPPPPASANMIHSNTWTQPDQAASLQPVTARVSTGPAAWREALDLENRKPGEEEEEEGEAANADPVCEVINDPRNRMSQLGQSNGCCVAGYAQVVIRDPDDLKHGQEAAKAAVRLLHCLEVRRKYVGAAVGERVEPDIIKYVAKTSKKIEMAAVLAQFDGDTVLSSTEEARRIVWDPFTGSPPPRDPNLDLSLEGGLFLVRNSEGALLDHRVFVGVDEFCRDYVEVLRTMLDRGCVSYCEPRLHELDLKFQLHTHRNAGREAQRQREMAGRDWYQVRKVDTHIHHSACFTQRQLMQFIRRKMREEMDTPVAMEGGRELTLREVFTTAGIHEVEAVNQDRLCCMASIGAGGGRHDTFGRFDRFNSKYNPFGDKRLREIFLKTDNYIEGRFLAELTKEVMQAHQQSKFVCAEWRISIYGKSQEEWIKLARWFRRFHIKCEQIRWLIQVPRLYPLFRKLGKVNNFAEMLRNIFEPLFQATLDPLGHEDMFFMLQQIVGFDSVDDESQGSSMTLKEYPTPEEWTGESNPPYTYWMYYMYANIRSLNATRRHRGMNTFAFRPHCGEAGNVSHLCSGFMLAESVCHGVQLKESPVLQYLYYLAQVGLAVSPLSNDILFVPLAESPFGEFFRRGLNVSLSTDDPLIIHLTEEALIEEYVVAARTFRLSVCDLCEIARNSVLQSGFEYAFKHWWVGDGAGVEGHVQEKANVPLMRLHFRSDCLRQEMATLSEAAAEVM